VTFLGTSSAAPSRSRGLPAIAVQRESDLIIMDCGEGIQRQLLGLGLGLNRDTLILITHLHGDHVTGLLGLLQTMSLAQRKKELTVVAPPALLEWLEHTSHLLHIGLTFGIRFVPARSGTVITNSRFDVRAARAEHSVEAFCYLVRERARPGIFFPERARKLGIPEGKLWSRLQKGGRVKLEGRVIEPRQVMGPSRPGRAIGYSGDTRPSKRLARFFRGADLLIFDSTFANKDSAKALERKHCTSSEAARVAKEAGVKKLVLTHFSARYKSVSVLVREARSVFPSTIAAADGLRLDVDYPEG